MDTTYRGRRITVTRPTLGNECAIRCKITMNGQTWYGAPGLLVADQLAELRRMIDNVDSETQRVTAVAYWYAPGTVEVCPLGAGSAYGEHLRFTGKECMERGCVRDRVQRARARARRYGITGASVSNLLTTAGFTAYDIDSARHGFSASGVQARRAVSLHQRDKHGLEPMAEVLRAHGLYVVWDESGRHLWVYSRTEAVAQGMDVGPEVAPPAPGPKPPTTPAARAVLKRAGLALAKPSSWGSYSTEGLYTVKGAPGTVEVHWHTHEPDYTASRARGAAVLTQAAGVLSDAYTAVHLPPSQGDCVVLSLRTAARAEEAAATV